jgi:hypothetical protein
MNPEIMLWSRVLLQAIWDLAGIKLKMPKSEAPRLQRTTRAWFTSSDRSAGSFIWICHTLSLDPATVRRHVLTKGTAELEALIANRSEWEDGQSSEEMQQMISEAV